MKKLNIIMLIGFLFSAALFNGCSKDDDNNTNPVPAIPAKLTINMDHLAGLQKFYFDSSYTTSNGDVFTADLFKYYVSNVRLIRTDNSEYKIPESYFLVNHDVASSLQLEMDSLENGYFKGIKFILGVDSASNVSGAQAGALDPVNGMFWNWNTGYIFLKLEGTSAAIPTPAQTFTYHIGGFSGANVNYKEVSFGFDGDILPLAINTHPELHLVVDVLEIFKDPTTIDLSTFPSTVTFPTPDAALLANNYSDMIKYDHIHND